MFKKIGKVIINNFGLKVLGAVFAVIIWLVIVNGQDPDKAATFTIPVSVVNADYLTEQGKTYEILDNTDSISFTVNGKRSIVETLTADDFRATANMMDIDDSMSMVPIVLTATSYSSQLELTTRQSYMMVSVENLVTKEFAIDVTVEDTPETGCYVESTQADPAVVTVTGPQSEVDQIDSAQAAVSVDGEGEDFTAEVPVFLLDENGGEIETEHLSVDVAQTDVSVQIYMTKTVPLRFVVTGTPAEGYWFSGVECDVDSVRIEGEASAIRDVEEIVVDSARLNVADADQDVTVNLTIANYLPEGVALAEEEPGSIEVTLPVEEAVTVEVEMPAKNITVTDLAEDLELTIRGESVTVEITGPADDVESVNGNRLSGTINAADLSPGNYNLSVVLETDGSYDAEATASVSITQIE